MEQIHALHLSSGPSISAVLPSTFKIFAPLLTSAAQQNRKSIPVMTYTYDAHPRQTLDIYQPADESEDGSEKPNPILIFFHGGGLIRGDKNLQMPGLDPGVIYANLGSFFAKRGIMTVVPNYRRVDFQGGGEGARFPSGGEDVAAVLEWLDGYLEGIGDVGRDIYLLGNSAGGVHVSTFLLADQFAERRKMLVTRNGEGKRVLIKGIANLAVPCHFKHAEKERAEVLETYYGKGKDDVKEKCVCGLLDGVRKSGVENLKRELGIPERMWFGVGEFDPEDEIAGPMRDFVGSWKEAFGEEGVREVRLEGHNHISPPVALGSGDVKGEMWGEEFVKWMRE